ncbi:MAG: tRNA-intron lyase [archaeon]
MKPKKKPARDSAFKAVLSGEKIFSNAHGAFTLHEQSSFGEPIEGKVYYSVIESLYLIEKGKMQMYLGGKKVSFDSFLEKSQKIENNVHTRFIVFRDMRNKGYTLKTALKFGADFRVYERGVKPGQEHAKWILYAVHETVGLTWHEFAAKNRVAHSTKKRLLIGIVDDENDVTYYEIAWKKP